MHCLLDHLTRRRVRKYPFIPFLEVRAVTKTALNLDHLPRSLSGQTSASIDMSELAGSSRDPRTAWLPMRRNTEDEGPKALRSRRVNNGSDGIRTRDLWRDRPAL
jgi:hypothetical protein